MWPRESSTDRLSAYLGRRFVWRQTDREGGLARLDAAFQVDVTRTSRVFVRLCMRLRWVYLGLLAALGTAAVGFQVVGSTEVASHAFFHLSFAVVGALLWFIPPPVSAPNRWVWRAGWAVSAAWWIEALGAFGYDDQATSAVPGLHSVHNVVAPLVLLAALIILIASACALALTRLRRPVAYGLVVLASVGSLFLIVTAVGLGP